MGVREIDQSLEQWEMNAKDVHLRMILAPTPRERERCLVAGPGLGRPRPQRRLWKGTPIPLADGQRPSGREGLRR